jgi:hypothetical protein
MKYEPGETAVIVPVPAAEPAVADWRHRFDRSAPFGVPAHITVVFPFVPSALLTDTDLFDLRSLFALQPAFELTLAGFGRFPGVLYLDPDPAAPFRAFTAAMVSHWPDFPPYGGAYDDPIPHLTVTEIADDAEIAEAQRDIAPKLPIVSTLTRALLVRFDGQRWVTEQELPFGA